jgi:hypothetical protein
MPVARVSKSSRCASSSIVAGRSASAPKIPASSAAMTVLW